MKLLQAFCILLLSLSTHAYGQDSETGGSVEQQELANLLNLRLQTMQIALGEIRNLKSDLELVESQREGLETLSKDYAQMVQGIMQLEKGNAGTDESIALCLRKMKGFEDRLSSEILLPHQNSELRKMVFAKLVSENDEDWFATLSTYYPAKFKFTVDQQQQMKKIKSSTAKKIAKAKKEFDEKLEEIRDAARDEIQDVLTEKQSKFFAELSGHTKK